MVLRFEARVSARVREATWHPSQEVRELADGSLEWRARVAGTIEIRLWILSWGDEVEVIAPAALRDDVAGDARPGGRPATPAAGVRRADGRLAGTGQQRLVPIG